MLLPLARALALAAGRRRGALPAAHRRALAAATKGYSAEDGSLDASDDAETFEVELRPMESHRLEGCPPPPGRATTSRSQLLAAYEAMYRMRRCEVAADMLYKSNAVRGLGARRRRWRRAWRRG